MQPTSRSAELHLFGCPAHRPGQADPQAVGHKAANLMQMAQAGLPVPAGFVLPVELCRAYFQNGQRLPAGTGELAQQGIRAVEEATGLTFGGDRRPLLVSVRSGAAVSMPGMLDTLLNVGLGARTLPALIRMTGNPRHAWDSYRRLVQAHAEVVQHLPADPFERILGSSLEREGAPLVTELDVAALKSLTSDFIDIYETKSGESFPQEPLVQLTSAVEAVFRSWQSPRAVEYRRLRGLDDLAGTAVTVQAMVFGNAGATSGSGVGFTRDPATGEAELYLDFLWNSQGEDVVSGRTFLTAGQRPLPETHPELYRQLQQVGGQLELLFRDAQDFEFTVQEGRLFLLQSRAAKRTAWATLRIACDQVQEGLIDESTALARLAGYDLASIHAVRVVSGGQGYLGQGVPASPGVAVGEAVFAPERAVELASTGRLPVLIREDLSTADIAGLATAIGVLTARGGRTSHAAVVARQLNKVCVVGCRELIVQGQGCRIGEQSLEEGAPVSLDGNSGRIYRGRLEVVEEKPTSYLREVERWKARFPSRRDKGG